MSQTTKTVRELFEGADVDITGQDVPVVALVSDSRRVTAGACFASLSGARVDGHDFIPKALDLGATSVLCEREVDVQGATRIVARDARAALAVAARRFFDDPAAELTMVGVTGTNGKTTTTHLIEALLAAAGGVPAVIGTLGARYRDVDVSTGLTTPGSLELLSTLRQMLDAGVTGVAMEVSSHALAQHRVGGVSYDVGVFTNLTHDHLDYHGTMEAYFQAKARLFSERLKPHGRAVINYDDPFGRRLCDGASLTFSAQGAAEASVRVTRAQLGAESTELELVTPRGGLTLRSPLVGRFNIENTLAAVAVGEALQLPHDVVTRALATCRAVPGRLERVSGAGQPLVVVDYAHTPDALDKALTAVREITSGRLLCVFGCGGDRDPKKRPVMGEVAKRRADYSIVTSDNPRSEDPRAIVDAIVAGFAGSSAAYEVELDRALAIKRAVALVGVGDAVLVAGKGHETYQIVGDETRHFDDREEARAALQKKYVGADFRRPEETLGEAR